MRFHSMVGFWKLSSRQEFLPGGPQIVEALGHALGGKMLYALELNDHDIFDKDVGEILPNAVAFVGDGK